MKALLIDEQREPLNYYLHALARVGLVVEQVLEVDSGLEKACDPSVDLLILDCMMPPGNRYRDVDTQLGLRTGVEFMKDLRKVRASLPVAVLTSVTDVDTLRRLEAFPPIWIFSKLDYPPYDFADEVLKILATPSTAGGA